MSFILEALRKSEHKRRAQATGEATALCVPTKKTDATSGNTNPGNFLLLGIFLLLAILVWQRPWSSRESTDPSVPVVVAEQAVNTSVAQGTPAEVPAPQEHIGPSQQPSLMDDQEPAEEAPFPPLMVTPPATAPITAPLKEPAAMSPSGPAEVPLYSISDLPAEVRRRLPALQMALHAYNATAAGASLVQINGRLVREGTQITDDLRVDEITADGAVLRTGDYRFLLPAVVSEQ